MAALTICASLGGYPHVATPRIHTVGISSDEHPVGFAFRAQLYVARLDADAGTRTRITAATGPHAGRITPRRHRNRPGRNRTDDLRIQSPASLASGDSGAQRSRSYRYGAVS